MQTRDHYKPPLGRKPKVWGLLIPCSSDHCSIEFDYTRLSYKIGSSTAAGVNHVVLPDPSGRKISPTHCTISWDGLETTESIVTVQDTSSCGTFINGDQIGGGNGKRFGMLRDGNEIAFGGFRSTSKQHPIHRYIFRHVAVPVHSIHDSYHISSGPELGKGAFGTVMKAMARENGQTVAVKLIQYENFIAPGKKLTPGRRLSVKQLVEKEVQVMVHAGKHKNICQFKEAFFTTDYIYLILEYVGGGDLFHYLEKQPRGYLLEREARDFACQTVTAVSYLHELNIVHRDLKPENLLVTSEKPHIIKVADFGLAKIIDDNTMAKTMCGTPIYQAPEVRAQVQAFLRCGRRERIKGYNKIVDSYSVGVITFVLLTGQMPDLLEKQPPNMNHISSPLQEMGVSALGVQFVKDLMAWVVSERMAIKEAVRHGWFAQEVLPDRKLRNAAKGNIPPEKKPQLRRKILDSQKADPETTLKPSRSIPGRFRAPSIYGDDDSDGDV